MIANNERTELDAEGGCRYPAAFDNAKASKEPKTDIKRLKAVLPPGRNAQIIQTFLVPLAYHVDGAPKASYVSNLAKACKNHRGFATTCHVQRASCVDSIRRLFTRKRRKNGFPSKNQLVRPGWKARHFHRRGNNGDRGRLAEVLVSTTFAFICPAFTI